MEHTRIKKKQVRKKKWLKEKGILILILLFILGLIWEVWFNHKAIISVLVSLFFLWLVFNVDFAQLTSLFEWWEGKHWAVAQKVTNFRFRDVGGCQEAKEELKEIVAFLRNPQLFQQSGAKLPKGVLLVGPHGNGKTLLGKALAGECQLPFLFRSGSEFEEMVVGLGARRIRELFAEARSYPNGCIIFIDEIDSIGRRRNTHNSNDLTLNQLLNELDGFNPRENIFILAATNFPQVLDAALLRPGRFDRQIFITLPNLQARREIIKLATPKIPFRQDVDLEEVASLTRGFSGAQIVNLFNEATLLCLRYNHKKISQEHIFEAHDRVLMGPSSLSHTIHPSKKKIVAFHEAGHAIIGLSLPETSVKKITVVPRWTAGGYTWIDLRGEHGDDNLISKNQILAQVKGLLGGRAAEELIFGSEHITVGAHSDFKKVSQLVSEFIFHHGMSSLGIVPTSEFFYWRGESATESSEKSKEKIAVEREKILDQCWKKVRFILWTKKKVLLLLTEILLSHNSLNQEEINYIFVNQLSPFIPFLNNLNHG